MDVFVSRWYHSGLELSFWRKKESPIFSPINAYIIGNTFNLPYLSFFMYNIPYFHWEPSDKGWQHVGETRRYDNQEAGLIVGHLGCWLQHLLKRTFSHLIWLSVIKWIWAHHFSIYSFKKRKGWFWERFRSQQDRYCLPTTISHLALSQALRSNAIFPAEFWIST